MSVCLACYQKERSPGWYQCSTCLSMGTIVNRHGGKSYRAKAILPSWWSDAEVFGDG